jgi:glutathione S-transferase
MTRILYELCGADETALFSPHCWKARMALLHKGLDFETKAIGFATVAQIEGGGRRVPVLRDADHVVEDSFAIAKYLDEAYPNAPTLVPDAALMEFIINWSQVSLHVAVAKIAVLDIWKMLAPTDQEHFRTTREKMFGMTLEEFNAKNAKDGKLLSEALTPLVLTLKKQPYLGGESPNFADYVPFGALQWLRTTSSHDVLPKEGPVAEWFNRLLDMYDGNGRAVAAAA